MAFFAEAVHCKAPAAAGACRRAGGFGTVSTGHSVRQETFLFGSTKEYSCHCAWLQVFGEESFYAWTYDKPTSPWVYVGAGGAVVVSLLLSLFPLAPNWVKVRPPS